MAYAVATMPDGRIKMSDGTIQEAPNSFKSGASVSTITPNAPTTPQVSQVANSFTPPRPTGVTGSPIGPDLSQIPDGPRQAPQEQIAQPQGQPTQAPDVIHQITSDILAGMKPTEIEKYYPEMKGADISIFTQLASDIGAGMPSEEAPKYYPEIFPQETVDWSKSQPVVNRSDMQGAQKVSQENQPIFQDQHPNEGILEQIGNALYRAPVKAFGAIGGGIKDAAMGGASLILRGADALNEGTDYFFGTDYGSKGGLAKDIKDTTGSSGFVGDLALGTAGATTAQFNAVKAPLATGLALASELPGTQYIMQGISGAIEGTVKKLSDITGVDYETMQNIITTGMNTLGLKTKGGTVETAQKAGKAFQEAPTISKGVLGAGKSVAGDVLKNTKDVAAMIPVDAAKGVGSLVMKGLDKIPNPLPKDFSNNTAESMLLKQWKLDKKTRDTLKAQGEDNGARFVLERDLQKGDIEQTADNVGKYKYDKMQEKLDAVDTFGDTKVPEVAVNMSTKMKEKIDSTLQDSYGKITPEEIVTKLQQNHPEYAKMYSFLSDIQKSDTTSFSNLEKLKELYDATNPENLKWDIQNKPENQIAHDLVAQKRLKLQGMIEDQGTKMGVDIKEINKEIQKATTVQRGLDKASSRRENLNMFGLGDSQTAIVSAILGGAPGAIGALLFKKGLESETIRGTIARKLFTKTPKNDLPISNSVSTPPSQSRVGRIMNRGDSNPTSEVKTAKQRLKKSRKSKK